MGRSAASKLRRKSQREASELREQTYNKFFQDTLAMEEEELVGEDREEEEEVVFKRRRTVPSVHRPAEQVFALEEDDDQEEEMFAVVDRQQWNTQRAAEPPLSPELQQMFALARRMGYEMRPLSRRFDAPRQTPGSRQTPNRDYRAPFKPRDYSRTKCFSCGQLGHTQVRCPKPDSSLPFRPSGWVDRSDGP